ncbi:hypothetical protein GQ607_010748 [Colletotrichum asianum]|uniref:Uncharacterized protein n=1 Tax=Colletotrichum asianum TaxID=702518 RepID=A0A8H3WCA1_9PEZI|nr:hypothetical protein GQ607_010748 [Colletotrichum asianum]
MGGWFARFQALPVPSSPVK